MLIRSPGSFAVLLFLMLASSVATAQITYKSHAGQIVDDSDGSGLEALAVAYQSDTRVGGSAERCAMSDGRALDITISEPTRGRFRFLIDEKEASYIAAYCKSGYVPEFRKRSNNSQDGTPIERSPIRLMQRPRQ
jgi:hypothetical protein